MVSLMNGSLRIARVFGIPVAIHYSWLVIFALVVWSLGADYFPMHHPGVVGAANWLYAVIAAALFFLSILVHEMAHSLVARTSGIPVESITLFALGGVSGLKADATRPRTELAVSVVGPLVSLALAAGFWLVSRSVPADSMALAVIAFYLAYGNLVLGLFNLIPGFPLDGGRVLRAVAWAVSGDRDGATRLAVTTGRVAAGLLIFVGLWQTLTSDTASGLWQILIGWFLWSAGAEEGARATIESALRGHTVAELTRRDIVVFDGGMNMQQAAARIATSAAQAVYPVVAEGTLLGTVKPEDFAAVPPEGWVRVSMNWLARRSPRPESLRTTDEAGHALTQLGALGVEGLAVIDPSGAVVGLFEHGAILRWIQPRGTHSGA